MKKNPFRFKNLSGIFPDRDSLIVSVVGAIFFVCAAFGLSQSIVSTGADPSGAEEATSIDNAGEDSPSYRSLVFSRPHSLLKDLDAGSIEEEFEPGPEILNMAFFYADDADTSDAIHSYAGNVFEHLNSENADLYAGFYDLTDTTPLKEAESMGLTGQRVMGGFNPLDSAHDPGNSSTWTVNSFSNVNVSFYDGDGHRIDGYYIAKEIMSLASVYMYYRDDYDPEHFREYCDELFENALSYKVSLGSVYYCTGCLTKSIAEESAEALAIEAENLIALSGGEIETIIDTSSAVTRTETAETLEEILETQSEEPSETTIGVIYYTDDASGPGTATDIDEDYDGVSGVLPEASSEITATDAEPAPAETLPETTVMVAWPADASDASDIEPETTIEYIIDTHTYDWSAFSAGLARMYTAEAAVGAAPGETAGETETTEGTDAASPDPTGFGAEEPLEEIYDPDFETASDTPQVIYWEPADEVSNEESEEETGRNYSVYNSSINDTPKYRIVDGVVVYDDLDAEDIGVVSAEQSETAAMPSETPEESSDDEVSERIATLLSQANIQTSAESYCPGHIDIYVSITIRGIDDQNSLFACDEIGSDETLFDENWQGWTDEMKEHARKLCEKDWFEEYGLSISSIKLYSALTDEDIEEYLSRLSPDISDERKEIVKYALESVGKVPYYWGGKPSGPGYEANSFGVLISADTRGRILKGLDCSGWVNWIYWSVTGTSLPGQSTGTLVGCGRKIQRADLEPGDIVIRVGSDAHVVMFLCWAEDGDFYAVHETGGVINNVTVSKMTANWPYYRSLAD